MTTIATPRSEFEAVLENANFVRSGLAVAERIHGLPKLWFSAVTLTFALRGLVRVQARLLEKIRASRLAEWPKEELLDVADGLDELVGRGERIWSKAVVSGTVLWKRSLAALNAQNEEFDSLAESLRMTASDKFGEYLNERVADADREASTKEESWRDFVASLQD